MKNNDFKNYGTYRGEEADKFKKRLEEEGIPVKKQYPGTNVGTSTTGNAYSPSVTLLIRRSDFKKAEKIREELEVSRVEDDAPLPVGYDFFKNNNSIKLFVFLALFSIVAALVYDGVFSEDYPELIPNADFYFLLLFFIFSTVAIAIWFYKAMRKWFGS